MNRDHSIKFCLFGIVMCVAIIVALHWNDRRAAMRTQALLDSGPAEICGK